MQVHDGHTNTNAHYIVNWFSIETFYEDKYDRHVNMIDIHHSFTVGIIEQGTTIMIYQFFSIINHGYAFMN